MDKLTNLPVKIDVYEVEDVTSALGESDIKLSKAYSYPDSFGMLDLSPSSYNNFNTNLLNNESVAVNFNAKTMMKHSDTKTECDERCRK